MSRPTKRQRTGDYRIFVGAFPEGELAVQLQALREQYDPVTARISPPHVTLAGTYWREGAATAENEERLIERLYGLQTHLQPFELILGGIRRFGNRVVYLGVRSTEELLQAREVLTRLIGRDKHRRFTPHLTLAMRLSPQEMDAMVQELQQTEWESERYTAPIRELHLMQRGPDDPAWRSIARLPLS